MQPSYAPAQPSYAPPQPSYAPARPSYAPAQPSYAGAGNAPFTAFGSSAHSGYAPITTAAPAQPTYNVPAIEAVYEPIDKPGNFPAFNSLPGFAGATYLEPSQSNYEAQASFDSPKGNNCFYAKIALFDTRFHREENI